MRVVAQAVLGGLVAEQGVEHVGARAQARAQRLGGGPRRPARGPRGPGREQARERLLQRGRLVAVGQLHLDGGDLLGEQAPEGRRAAHVELGDDALLGLAELVRAVAAQRAQVVAAEVEPLGGEQLLGPLVRQQVPLELEEQQLRLDRRAQLARLLDQGAARRVGRVEGEPEHRVRARPAGEIVDRAQLVHGVGEAGGVELGHAAAVALGEGGGALARLDQQLLDPGRRRGSRRAARGPRRRPAGRDRSVVLITPRLVCRRSMVSPTPLEEAPAVARGRAAPAAQARGPARAGRLQVARRAAGARVLPRAGSRRGGHRLHRQPRRGHRVGGRADRRARGGVPARGGERHEARAARGPRRRGAPGRGRRGRGQGPRARLRGRAAGCPSSRTAPSRRSSRATRRSGARSSSSSASGPACTPVPVGNGALLIGVARGLGGGAVGRGVEGGARSWP